MGFDYFSVQQVQNNQFKQFPSLFLDKNSRYFHLSNEAKLAYTLMKDRFQLSLIHNWVDEDNHVFIYMKVEDLAETLNISNRKASDLRQELEEANLIKQQRQGLNRPNRIYVSQLDQTIVQEIPLDLELEDENPKDLDEKPLEMASYQGHANSAGPDMQILHTNNTKKNKTESKTIDTQSIPEVDIFKSIHYPFLSQSTLDILKFFRHPEVFINKIYKSKQQIENESTIKLHGELFEKDVEALAEKLFFEVKQHQQNGETIKDLAGYWYQMLIQMWSYAVGYQIMHPGQLDCNELAVLSDYLNDGENKVLSKEERVEYFKELQALMANTT